MKHVLVVLLALGLGPAAVAAPHPCKPKRALKSSSRKALRQCLDSWSKDGRPGDPSPADECSAKLSSFVQSSKDLRLCRAEHRKKR